jgi:Glycosyltransferase family 87
VRLVALLGGGIVLALACAVGAAYGPGTELVNGVGRNDTWSIVFLAATGTAFALYAAALMFLRGRLDGVRVVCALAVAIQLVPLAGPVLLSRDVYSYWAYGRIVWAHDSNPYDHPPADFPHDPATAATAGPWRQTTSVYGPVFTGVSAGVAAVAGSSKLTAAFLFRVAAALAVLVTAFLAARLARHKALSAALVGWNPLFAVHFAGGGHNDALMVACMVAALALTPRSRDRAAGALWLVAAAIKSAALVLFPLVLPRSRRGVWFGALAALLVITLVASVAFGDAWWSNFSGLNRREAGFSIPSRLDQLGLGEFGSAWLPKIVLAVGGAWLFLQALRGRVRLGLAAGLLLVTSQWILPWYGLWPIGLAAAEEDGAAQLLGVALAAYLVADRVPI